MTATNSPATLDQQRARHAWKVVESVVKRASAESADQKRGQKAKKEFGTQAKKLPARILAAGLGQALAFLEAQDYAPELRQALADWIHDRRPAPANSDRRLVSRVVHGDADFLRFATAECLAYLQWLVRFADAAKLTDKAEG
jgi:CRISPR-associated protein Cmr5